MKCLDKPFQAVARSHFQFHCPQHQCADCQQKTGDAGGMLYRCRWCERSYCEDCLDWEKTQLLGDNLKEYELLGFPPVVQAFYIQCHGCTESRLQDENLNGLCTSQEKQIDLDHATWTAKEEEPDKVDPDKVDPETHGWKLPSREESMVDWTTCDDSGLSTPNFNAVDAMPPPARSGKAARKILQLSAPKRPTARG